MPDAGLYTNSTFVFAEGRTYLALSKAESPLRDSAGISFGYSGLNPDLAEGSPDFTLLSIVSLCYRKYFLLQSALDA